MALEALLITGRHPTQVKQVNNRVEYLSVLAPVSASSLSSSSRGDGALIQLVGCALSDTHQRAQTPEQPRSAPRSSHWPHV